MLLWLWALWLPLHVSRELMQGKAWVLLSFTSPSPVLAANGLWNELESAQVGPAETVQRDLAAVERPFPVWSAGS